MSPARLSEVLQYPSVWLKAGLLCEELVAIQAPQVICEYGSSIPEGGTEHWRYYAFNFWMRRGPDVEQLQTLLEAAVADPDPPMVGNVLKQIAAHHLCTAAMLKTAKACVAQSPDYYVRPSELEQLFHGRGPSA